MREGETPFALRKQRVLYDLMSSDTDKSPKGFVDEPIAQLIQDINASERFCTTSSCSGRIALFHTKRDDDHHLGKWVLVEHRTISSKEVFDMIQSCNLSSNSKVYLKFEPFILAVECATIQDAQMLLRIGVDAGFRESGISAGTRIITTIRSTSRLDIPIVVNGNAESCSPDFIASCIAIANQRFDSFSKRIDLFHVRLQQVLRASPVNASTSFLKVPKRLVSKVKPILQHHAWADTRRRRIFAHSDGCSLCIPIRASFFDAAIGASTLDELTGKSLGDLRIETCQESPQDQKEKPVAKSPHQKLVDAIHDSFGEDALDIDIPTKWELFGNDLVLFPEGTFQGPLSSQLSSIAAQVLGVSRVGRQARIDPGLLRSSRAELTLGDTGMVLHRENGIWYEFDVTKCMFASGNGSEKQRLRDVVQDGESVVDLYAGIGYFTLPILVKYPHVQLFACEWNPHSVSALQAGLFRNKVDPARCTIFQGDNRKHRPELDQVADRVLLGLIPSSEDGWPVAVRALKPTGGWLHVHANVHENEVEAYQTKMVRRLYEIAQHTSVEQQAPEKAEWNIEVRQVSNVKSYSPKVNHYVFDVYCGFANTTAPLEPRLLDQVPVCSPAEFDQIRVHCFPTIIRGTDLGTQTQLWTPLYLASKLEDTKVVVHESESRALDFVRKNFVYKTMPFCTLMEHVQEANNSGKCFYLRALGSRPKKDRACFKKDFPSLYADWCGFEGLPFPQERYFSSVFRVGSDGMELWTHYDVLDNVLCQIKGCKRVILFPPSQAHNLYVSGSSSRVVGLGLHPTADRFPAYPRFNEALAHSYEVILKEGDILYIPALWFHNVYCIGTSISVNVFWKELPDAAYSKSRDLYGNKDHEAGEQLIHSIEDAIHKLSRSPLPPHYAKFYASKASGQLLQ